MTTIQLYGRLGRTPEQRITGTNKLMTCSSMVVDLGRGEEQPFSAGALTNVGHRPMTTDTEPVPLFERFTVTYQSGTVIPSFYPGGATLREVQVSHPLATVEAVEDSRVGTETNTP